MTVEGLKIRAANQVRTDDLLITNQRLYPFRVYESTPDFHALKIASVRTKVGSGK